MMARKTINVSTEAHRGIPTLGALTKSEFQSKVYELWKHAKGKPKAPVVYNLQEYENVNPSILPLKAEVELSEGFAYVAAVQRGVESVSASAVCVPHHASDGLKVLVASNDGVRSATEDSLRCIVQALQKLALQVITGKACNELILMVVLGMNTNRINSRLRSRRNTSPVIMQGVQQILNSLPLATQRSDRVLEKRLSALYRCLQAYNMIAKSDPCIQKLKTLVLACYQFWCAPGSTSTRAMLEEAGIEIDMQQGSSCLAQIAKIAAYPYICKMMVAYASDQRFGKLFQRIVLSCVPAHDPIETVVPRTVAGGGNYCRVHAEVQLVLELDTKSPTLWRKPRTIGSSKAACFLCDLFLRRHEAYLVPRSHGMLTPFWAIPNLRSFTAVQRERYEEIIVSMERELVRLTNTPHLRRCDPAMSWQALSRLEIRHDWDVSSNPTSPTSTMHDRLQRHSPSDQEVPAPEEEVLHYNAGNIEHGASWLASTDNQDLSITSKLATRSSSRRASYFMCMPDNVEDQILKLRTSTAGSSTELAHNLSQIASEHTRDEHSRHNNSAVAHDQLTAAAASTTNSETCHQKSFGSRKRPYRSEHYIPSPESYHLLNISSHTETVRGQIRDRSSKDASTTLLNETIGVFLPHKLSPPIVLPELVLFIENETPINIFMTAEPCLPRHVMEVTPVVEIDSLKPGDEVVMPTTSGSDTQRGLHISKRSRSGLLQCWAIKWDLNVMK